ncbi:MAG: tetratricopeptide repeat protein [Firmicutes bacterium]|nr:tetratricopeptide repeat protein [Bacillota bacterium]
MNRRMVLTVAVVLVLAAAGVSLATGSLDPAERQLKLAYKLLNEGKYEEAILAFQNVIEIEPRNTEAYAGLGLAYAHNGQYDKAFATVNGALAMGLDDPELLHEAMVEIYLKKGDESGARRYIRTITDQKILDYLKKKFPELFESMSGQRENEAAVSQRENQVVKFKDPCFEKAIRVMLDKPNGDIWSDELAEIDKIRIDGPVIYRGEASIVYDKNDYGLSDIWFDGNPIPYGGIKSADDLIWFPNLKNLGLNFNRINDISALKNSTNLRGLNLYNNQINDISALKDLTNLQGISLEDNQISDISALKDLINLERLYLSDNQISDISALSNLRNLNQLGLSHNRISDINTLSNLRNLTRLFLNYNQISDISVLKNLTNLETLDLGSNRQISDIGTLKDLTNLKKLYLSVNQISDISVLSNLTNLEDLDLSENPISDYTPALNLPNLRQDDRKRIEDLAR